MGDTEEERSMLEDVQPRGKAEIEGRESGREGEHSVLTDLNHIGDHIQTLEEAARAARVVEFEQLRSVVGQLELVADAAKGVERDLTQSFLTRAGSASPPPGWCASASPLRCALSPTRLP